MNVTNLCGRHLVVLKGLSERQIQYQVIGAFTLQDVDKAIVTIARCSGKPVIVNRWNIIDALEAMGETWTTASKDDVDPVLYELAESSPLVFRDLTIDFGWDEDLCGFVVAPRINSSARDDTLRNLNKTF
tara:strand:- start:12793 stop:13182 length:390 start_codon:yes stop_codon:yes gene_type:complete